MPNLLAPYGQSEKQMRVASRGLLLLFGGLIAGQSMTSPLFVFTAIISLALIVLSFLRPWLTLCILAVYLPFEPFWLKFIPDDAYIFARYLSEGLIYVLAFVVLWKILTRQIAWRARRAVLPCAVLAITIVVSILLNAVHPTIALLGARQIVRFIFVYFIATQLAPTSSQIRHLTYALMGVVGAQILIALLQSVFGQTMDVLLLPSDARNFGEWTLTGGVSQFWEPGTRVFATLGRYDRLGNFLAFFFPIIVAVLYEKSLRKQNAWLWILLGGSTAVLLLTFSRASWFAAALGALFVAVRLHHDGRVKKAAFCFLLLAVGYGLFSSLQVSSIVELPGQGFVERFYETFSAARWRGEYYGLGRVYWLLQTPRAVISSAPIFGFGPGQFGGGAVAALHNTSVYDSLGLPFGVFGTEGIIDNNWFAIWGELGTLGLMAFLWLVRTLFVEARTVFWHATDPFLRALSGGYAGAVLGVCLIALLSTAFEIRTLAFYLWLYGGIIAAQKV